MTLPMDSHHSDTVANETLILEGDNCESLIQDGAIAGETNVGTTNNSEP